MGRAYLPSSRNSFVREVVENEANRDPRAPRPLDRVPQASRLQRAQTSQALFRGEDSFAHADFPELDSSEESLSSSPVSLSITLAHAHTLLRALRPEVEVLGRCALTHYERCAGRAT